jgi:hypothetical protein
MNFYKLLSTFVGHFLASWIRIRIRIPNTDPDPDPQTQLNTDPIRLRIRIHNPAFHHIIIFLKEVLNLPPRFHYQPIGERSNLFALLINSCFQLLSCKNEKDISTCYRIFNFCIFFSPFMDCHFLHNAGYATAGRSSECTIVDKHHFGPIPGIEVSTTSAPSLALR